MSANGRPQQFGALFGGTIAAATAAIGFTVGQWITQAGESASFRSEIDTLKQEIALQRARGGPERLAALEEWRMTIDKRLIDSRLIERVGQLETVITVRPEQ